MAYFSDYWKLMTTRLNRRVLKVEFWFSLFGLLSPLISCPQKIKHRHKKIAKDPSPSIKNWNASVICLLFNEAKNLPSAFPEKTLLDTFHKYQLSCHYVHKKKRNSPDKNLDTTLSKNSEHPAKHKTTASLCLRKAEQIV